MRYVWTILLIILPGACSLAPGQLDLTKISAVNSCVQVSFQGSPAGGTASTTTTLPSSLPGGLGALATDTAPVAPTVTQTCTVNATTTDRHDASTAPAP